jgi:hypothetical protein
MWYYYLVTSCINVQLQRHGPDNTLADIEFGVRVERCLPKDLELSFVGNSFIELVCC